MNDQDPLLSSRFEKALYYTVQLHTGQTRKKSTTPYIAHLLSVTALVLEAGADEDVAIAALLHDAVEDRGGFDTLEEIRQRFGVRVASIVDECTDAYVTPKPPWRERKDAYIAHLHEATPEASLVSLADKLHNARSILRDLRIHGEETWDKFNGGKAGTLWYYRTLLEVFQESMSGPLVDELERVVTDIRRLADEED